MKFKCPVYYDIDNCSSKEYGLTCETCFHSDDAKDEKRYCTPSESLEQSLKEMKLMREGKLPKKTWNKRIIERKKENKMTKLKQIKCKNNNIKYQVRFGVNLFEEGKSGVFAKPEYFTTIKESKDEVINTFNTSIKEMFPDAECGDLIMVSDLKCDCGCNYESAKYDDGTELIGRMDIEFDGGEGYIEIIKG